MSSATPPPLRSSRLPSAPRIGVVAAFLWEVKPWLRKQPGARRLGRGLYSLMLEGQPAVLAVAGAGAQNSLQAAQRLITSFGVQSLLTVGFAGALTESLAPGDVIVADRVVEETTGGQFECRADLLPTVSARRGSLLCRSEVATSASEKRRLGELWGTAAVDMESAGVARAAAAAGLPFCAVKSITDSCLQTISIDFRRCRRDDGGLSFLQIVREGLTTWRGSKDLYRLAWSSRQAAGSLGVALGSL